MGTGTSEDVFNLLAIRGPTRSEGKPGIEPGSSDPQSSPLPLHHRGGLKIKMNIEKLIGIYWKCDERNILQYIAIQWKKYRNTFFLYRDTPTLGP